VSVLKEIRTLFQRQAVRHARRLPYERLTNLDLDLNLDFDLNLDLNLNLNAT
jgi:hypothetical protein